MRENNKHKSRATAIVISALLDRVALHPLDTIISLKQHTIKTASVSSIIKNLYSTSGYTGFYRGMLWPIYTSIPTKFTMLGSYLYLNDFYNEFFINSNEVKIYSGLTSGIVEALLTTPIEVYRVRKTFSTQPLQYNNLYRGFLPNLCRLMLGNTVIMSGTEIIADYLNINKNSTSSFFLIGIFMGILSQIVTTPIDVLKTRVILSDEKISLFNHTKKIINTKTYFNSLELRMIRQGLGAGIIMGILSLLNTEKNHTNSRSTSYCNRSNSDTLFFFKNKRTLKSSKNSLDHLNDREDKNFSRSSD